MLRPLVVALLATGTLLSSEASAQTPAPPLDVPPSPPSAQAWTPGQPAPPGYHVERRVHRGLVVAGSVVFGAAYLGIVVPALIIAARGSPAAATVTVPVGGPFYLVPGSLQGNDAVSAVAGLAVFDALVQAAGAGMLIGGLVGKRVLVPGPPRGGSAALVPVPLRFGSHGLGAGLAGTF